MNMSVDTIDGVTVALIPVEELDAGNVGEFKREIERVLSTGTRLVIDFSRLRFIDSSGLGVMLSCLRQLNAKGGDLKLCGMSKEVRGTFELVRMHRIFDIFASCEEAVRALSADEPGRKR